jgi:hypothetical protein
VLTFFFFSEELLNLHRGQGMDLFWRENLICPTEQEYVDMVNNSASISLTLSLRTQLTTSFCRNRWPFPDSDQADDGFVA